MTEEQQLIAELIAQWQSGLLMNVEFQAAISRLPLRMPQPGEVEENTGLRIPAIKT